jgi:hypothetical protein
MDKNTFSVDLKASSDESSSLPVEQWPTEPKPLQPSGFSAILYDAYDTFLCLIAAGAMIKVGLVIKASKDETARLDNGYAYNVVGPLTYYLIEFNGQVSLSETSSKF